MQRIVAGKNALPRHQHTTPSMRNLACQLRQSALPNRMPTGERGSIICIDLACKPTSTMPEYGCNRRSRSPLPSAASPRIRLSILSMAFSNLHTYVTQILPFSIDCSAKRFQNIDQPHPARPGGGSKSVWPFSPRTGAKESSHNLIF